MFHVVYMSKAATCRRWTFGIGCNEEVHQSSNSTPPLRPPDKIIRPDLHQMPNFLCKDTIKTEMGCSFCFLITKGTVWITWPSSLDKLVCSEYFALHKKPCKKFVLALGLCFPNIVSLEGAIGSIELCQISRFRRVCAIRCPAPKQLVSLIRQSDLLHEIPKCHKFHHLLYSIHAPKSSSPALIL